MVQASRQVPLLPIKTIAADGFYKRADEHVLPVSDAEINDFT
jgi:hypothetical protein